MIKTKLCAFRKGEKMFLKRTWAEIDISALLHNLNFIRQKANGKKIMVIVKADAYGHGVALVVPALEKAGVDAFGVSNIDEALELRKLGVKTPILILGYTPVSSVESLIENDITQTIYELNQAEQFSDAALKMGAKVKAHLKLDTGMSRLGFDCRSQSLNGFDEMCKALSFKGLFFDGVFTHYAVADETDDQCREFTLAQQDRFLKAIEKLKEKGFSFNCIHSSNSAGVLNYNFNENMCRAGIILYGLDPNSNQALKELKPVMQFKSVVSNVKEISCGDTVSYGRTFTAEKPIKVATVSVGYADGYPRLLSNKAEVIISGKRVKVIGRVCMDQMVVDVTETDVKIGDEVLLFGNELTGEEIARHAQTINYELVCGVSKRVPRIPKQ